MNRTSFVVVVALAFLGLLPARAALAHGPCGCLDPVFYSEAIVEKDTKVRVSGSGYPAYRVIVNPRPSDLGIAPDDLASAYRPDAPTFTVLSRPRTKPARNWSFRVPDVSPGVYLVLIFDGSEGGAHNTWDYIHVGGPASPLRRTQTPAVARTGRQPEEHDDFGGSSFAVLAAGIALGVLGSMSLSRARGCRG